MYEELVCQQFVEGTLNCTDGSTWNEPEVPLDFKNYMFWVYFGLSIFLVLFAGLCSGLTLGLLSMDLTTLSIISHGSDQRKKTYAAKIINLVSRHHQLLVTLLLSNAAAMETLPIFLDKISSPIVAILISVTAVLFFGEIIPQAICSRYGLAIGANLAWFVWILMIATWPLNWPLGILLDYLLGVDHGTLYQRDELKQLIDLHKKAANSDEGLNVDEITVIKGALDMTSMTVANKMIPLEKVYMLDENTLLSKTTLDEMGLQSKSRVPVYRDRPGNVVGIILVKNLIGIDAREARPIKDLLIDRVVRIPAGMSLYDLLNIFQTGAGHMAVVYPSLPNDLATTESKLLSKEGEYQPLQRDLDANLPDAIGICTLEDVLETLIKEEICDECDYARLEKVVRTKTRSRTIFSASTGLGATVGSYTTFSESSSESPKQKNKAKTRSKTTSSVVHANNRRTLSLGTNVVTPDSDLQRPFMDDLEKQPLV